MYNPISPTNVFVVIPAFNEYDTLQMIVDELLEKQYHLIVVDDGSEPSLFPLLKNKKLFFLRHSLNLGQGAALQTGIEFALSQKASYIVSFDADGQHKAADIENLLQALIQSNSAIALGSRFIHENRIPPGRKLLLKTGRFINYFFTGLFLTDAHNGLRAMTREAAEKIQLKENRMAHATEILSVIKKTKLKYVEVPVEIHYTEYSRRKGQTAMGSFRILFDLFLNKIFR